VKKSDAFILLLALLLYYKKIRFANLRKISRKDWMLLIIMGTIGYIPPGNPSFMQRNVFMYFYHWSKQFFCAICKLFAC